MKEVIEKVEMTKSLLPKYILLDKKHGYDQKTITNSFNNFFISDGPDLAPEIPQTQKSFETI